jgi:hypothetical protein
MTAEFAVVNSNGEEETITEGGEGQVVKILVQILGSDDPETAFLGALETGAIPDEICLELAEHLGELVKAKNLDNRLETALALAESEAISEKTQNILLLAILEMCEQERISVKTEIRIPIPEPTPIPSASGGVTGQASESPTPAPQAPPANPVADLIKSAVELQKQFGKNLPEDRQSELRQAVGKLTEGEFASLRQTLGSAILAQAEVPTDQRWLDVAASLEVVSILLGQRQAELTAAAFNAYEALATEGFRLTHRNEFDRPLMTVSSITLLRNHFRRWLDSHESGIGADELAPIPSALGGATGQASVQKALATLENFLLAAGDNRVKAAIRQDQTARLREQIVSSGIRALGAINEELIAALPQTKEKAMEQLLSLLQAKRAELASELRLAGNKTLAEAEAAIRQIFDLHSATAALRRELVELEANDYDPLAQRPMLSDREKRLVFFELERKELDSIRVELEAALEEAVAAKASGRMRKKLQNLLAVTAGKLCELDQLIAGLRPASEVSPVKLAPPVTGQEVCHG